MVIKILEQSGLNFWRVSLSFGHAADIGTIHTETPRHPAVYAAKRLHQALQIAKFSGGVLLLS